MRELWVPCTPKLPAGTSQHRQVWPPNKQKPPGLTTPSWEPPAGFPGAHGRAAGAERSRPGQPREPRCVILAQARVPGGAAPPPQSSESTRPRSVAQAAGAGRVHQAGHASTATRARAASRPGPAPWSGDPQTKEWGGGRGEKRGCTAAPAPAKEAAKEATAGSRERGVGCGPGLAEGEPVPGAIRGARAPRAHSPPAAAVSGVLRAGRGDLCSVPASESRGSLGEARACWAEARRGGAGRGEDPRLRPRPAPGSRVHAHSPRPEVRTRRGDVGSPEA